MSQQMRPFVLSEFLHWTEQLMAAVEDQTHQTYMAKLNNDVQRELVNVRQHLWALQGSSSWGECPQCGFVQENTTRGVGLCGGRAAQRNWKAPGEFRHFRFDWRYAGGGALNISRTSKILMKMAWVVAAILHGRTWLRPHNQRRQRPCTLPKWRSQAPSGHQTVQRSTVFTVACIIFQSVFTYTRIISESQFDAFWGSSIF